MQGKCVRIGTNKFEDRIMGFRGNFKEFKDSMLSRTLREWYLKQQDILQLLPPKPGAPGK